MVIYDKFSELEVGKNVDTFEDYKLVSGNNVMIKYLIFIGVLKYMVLLHTQLLTPYLII